MRGVVENGPSRQGPLLHLGVSRQSYRQKRQKHVHDDQEHK
jgi:hypothetical protein